MNYNILYFVKWGRSVYKVLNMLLIQNPDNSEAAADASFLHGN